MQDLENAGPEKWPIISQGLENTGPSHFSRSYVSIILYNKKVIPGNQNAMFVTSYKKVLVCMFRPHEYTTDALKRDQANDSAGLHYDDDRGIRQ